MNEIRKKWQSIISQNNYELRVAKEILGSEYTEKLENLQLICEAFEKVGIHVVADLCVIRSHEYYTSFSYEVDVLTNDNSYIEIAGGGRYDRLVSNFVPKNSSIKKVPCTGFAFGVERVINMLKQEKRLPEKLSVQSLFCFDSGSPKCIVPNSNKPDAYIKEFTEAIKSNEPFSVWLGN